MPYTFDPIPVGSVVLDSSTGNYYTDLGAGPGPLFPAPLLINLAAGFWVLYTDTPQTLNGRAIQLQALGDNGWYAIDIERNESDLPYTYITTIGLTINALRFRYTLENGCVYYSGDGATEPPIVPPAVCDVIPDFSVNGVVDVNELGLVAAGRWFIATNQFDITNAWSDHIGEITDTSASQTGTFTPVPDYGVVYDLGTTVYWWQTPNGPSPLFAPVTLTAGIGDYTLTSDWPDQSAAGTRSVIVEVEVDGNWQLFWSGYEFDLPQTIPFLGDITGVRIAYVYPDGCIYTVTGTLVADVPVEVDFTCDQIDYYTYRYSTYDAFLFTAPPGQTVTLTFAQGEMENSVECPVVIRGWSGTDTSGTSIPGLTNNFPNLNGVSGTSTGQYLYLEVDPACPMPDNLQTWLFGVQCAATGLPPGASAASTTDCGDYSFTVDVDIYDLGDSTTVGLSYSIDGDTPTVVPIDTPDIYTIGPFAVGAEVTIIIEHESDPLSNLMLGVFTDDGSCPILADPCAPEGAFKINGIGDLSDLPANPGLSGYAFLILSDVDNLGPSLGYQVGDLLGWNVSTSEWEIDSYQPGLWFTDNTIFVYSTGPGIQPYEGFPAAELTATGNNPNNFTLYLPAITAQNIPLNQNVALEVRLGNGPWQQVWTGTQQQLATPLPINVFPPFTVARMVYNYNECGYVAGVNIQLETD